MTLFDRTTRVLSLPIASDFELARPEEVVLRFPQGRTIDIGALCFLVREFIGDRRRKEGEYRKVDVSTFNFSRADAVRRLIFHISDLVRFGQRRPITVCDKVGRFIAFIGWADRSGWHDVLTEMDILKQCLGAYSTHLREQVWRMKLENNSAARQLHTVVAFCEDAFSLEDLRRGISLLKVDRKLTQSATPPSEELQSRVLSLALALTQGLAELVLEKKPFPHALNMPGYLNFPKDKLWVFPTLTWFVSPAMSAQRDTALRAGRGFNYEEGRLATMEELRRINSIPGLESFARNCDFVRRKVIQSSQTQLRQANLNFQHTQRRRLAQQAMSMFCLLFLAETGMNWAQVAELTWRSEFEVATERQGFRAIKWRAGGKLVSFELSIGFMPLFRTYLALRNFLLDGYEFEYLFLRFGPKAQSKEPGPMKGHLTTYTFDVLKRIDPSLDRITAREWRAAKSDWLIRNSDPSTASSLLQNSERTLLNSYAEGSAVVQLEEMSNFLNEVSKKVLGREKGSDGAVSHGVGRCQDYGQPKPISDAPAVPDCKRTEGCLFCEKYRVHADVVDTRKLLSYRHCLRASSTLGENEERIKSTFNPIFERIEAILNEIRTRDEAMVALVEDEVDREGELDSYWARKYEMLLAIGAIV